MLHNDINNFDHKHKNIQQDIINQLISINE